MSDVSLGKDEVLVTSLDDHWITLFLPIFLCLTGLGLSTLLLWVAWILKIELPELSLAIFVLGILSLFASFIWFFILVLAREFSEIYITNKRVIICDILPYVRHDVSFFHIHSVEELERRKHGLLANILNYGEVEVNVSGTTLPVRLNYFPRPGAFINLINELKKMEGKELDMQRLRKIYPLS